ncbi:hypothetical protein RRF57_002943 [Xylaria bambusicola]|uniref:Uncharacterized protein n=1 Tax=Xylaria bambusicola TaxID=326684 RepID=A0AAN7UFC3_9PEZI
MTDTKYGWSHYYVWNVLSVTLMLTLCISRLQSPYSTPEECLEITASFPLSFRPTRYLPEICYGSPVAMSWKPRDSTRLSTVMMMPSSTSCIKRQLAQQSPLHSLSSSSHPPPTWLSQSFVQAVRLSHSFTNILRFNLKNTLFFDNHST